jgi:hypothetical protein
MTAPIDYQSPSSGRRPSRIPTVLIVLVALVGLGVLLFRPLLGLLMAFALSGTSKSVPPADATRSVAVSLMHWGVFGTVPDRDPAYTNLENSIARGMTGINGFTESDGFHGDGTDWYEVDLSPDLAAELRTKLAQSPTVKKSNRHPYENTAPSWWPKTWPADSQCYESGLQYLVLPDTGTRAWFLRIRT